MRKIVLCGLCIFQIFFFSQVYGNTRATVISKNGRWLTINSGSLYGVKMGMKGKIKMDIAEGDKTYDITLGLFSVKKVREKTSSIYVEKIGVGANIGDVQYVVFNTRLIAVKKKDVKTSLGDNRNYKIASGKNIVWYLARGDEFFDKREYQKARANFQRVLKIDNQDPIAKIKIKECDEKLAQKKDEDKFYNYLDRADVYIKKSRVDYALNYYLVAYEIYPQGKPVVAQRIKNVASSHKKEWEQFYSKNREKVTLILDQPLNSSLPFSQNEKDVAESKKSDTGRPITRRNEREWSKWQRQFQARVSKVKIIARNTGLSPKAKKEAWESVLDTFNEDNPYSSKDDQLRSFIETSIEYWKKKASVIKPAGAVSVVTLRSASRTLTPEDVKRMLSKYGFYDSEWNKSKTFKNRFEMKVIKGNKVVTDQATGLMWHSGGSQNQLDLKSAKEWIEDLNKKSYAGYHDWRIPTLEEGASLVEGRDKSQYMFIDPLFSQKQRFIWTCDRKTTFLNWVVVFHLAGRVNDTFLNDRYRNYYVRPVRSMK